MYKIKFLSILPMAAILLAPPGLHAQPSAGLTPPQVQLHALVEKIQTKIKAGQNTEAGLADELKSFDTLIAAEKGAKTDEAAQIVYMKAMLYLEILKNNEKAAELIKEIKVNYPATKYGTNADNILASLAKEAAAKKIQAGLAAGAVFPDFAEKDLNGQPLSVGALKGRVVLVDFWATWCGPCRAELPNVIATYKKHHHEGFDIIGVSLDSERDKLDEFLKTMDGMAWPQFFDGQGWSNALAVKYGVEGIPFTILVGTDGKIISTDLRGDALEAAVVKALAKK
jgi:thiol-disulfide isomerase/thioredoxin